MAQKDSSANDARKRCEKYLAAIEEEIYRRANEAAAIRLAQFLVSREIRYDVPALLSLSARISEGPSDGVKADVQGLGYASMLRVLKIFPHANSEQQGVIGGLFYSEAANQLGGQEMNGFYESYKEGGALAWFEYYCKTNTVN
jgi:hypothetical protein